MRKMMTALNFAAVLTVGVFSIANSGYAKNLSDGSDGAEFGCFAMGVFAPEFGACLEKPWNMDRWQDTKILPPTFDNPFVPEALNPPVVIAPNSGAALPSNSGTNSGAFGSGYPIYEIFGRLDSARIRRGSSGSGKNKRLQLH